MSPRRRLLLSGVPALLFLCLLVLVATKNAAVLRFDAAISATALRGALAHPGWRALMSVITDTGAPVVMITAAVLAVAALAIAGRRGDAVFVAAVALASTGIRLVVLQAVARPRPAARLVPAAGWSFPSGHTTGSATAAAVILVLGLPVLARASQRVALTAVVLTWAGAVGLSRVALVVHWPTDVIAAWLLVTSVVVALMPDRRRLDPAEGTLKTPDASSPPPLP
jgi:undecaprenyl-diphosphatase